MEARSRPANLDKVTTSPRTGKEVLFGSLAGFELTSRRYLVIVSEKVVKLPPDLIDQTITYQYKSRCYRTP